MRQIVLDTETTGLKPEDGHRVIEIGCVELIDRQITGKFFHHYFNPEREIDAGALAVHGITQQFLLDKPKFSEVVLEFVEFIQDAELIIHNAPFDTGFLNYEFAKSKKSLKKIHHYCNILDTLVIARKLHPGQKNNLDALCKRYHVDNSKRDLHGALLDAEILARVYLAMTGGQVSLFGEQEQVNNKESNSRQLASNIQHRSFVIEATSEELISHHEYCEFLNKESKSKCVWQEE